jgi:putative flippase GtrA
MRPINVALIWELIRFYMAGALNAAFGYGLFAVLVWAGMGMYVAQAVAHVLGMAFNYVTYSRHVFRDAGPAKMRFLASYAVNYVISLGFLALASRFVHSPYGAGLISLVLTSMVNYVMLKFMVFSKRDDG